MPSHVSLLETEPLALVMPTQRGFPRSVLTTLRVPLILHRAVARVLLNSYPLAMLRLNECFWTGLWLMVFRPKCLSKNSVTKITFFFRGRCEDHLAESSVGASCCVKGGTAAAAMGGKCHDGTWARDGPPVRTGRTGAARSESDKGRVGGAAGPVGVVEVFRHYYHYCYHYMGYFVCNGLMFCFTYTRPVQYWKNEILWPSPESPNLIKVRRKLSLGFPQLTSNLDCYFCKTIWLLILPWKEINKRKWCHE